MKASFSLLCFVLMFTVGIGGLFNCSKNTEEVKQEVKQEERKKKEIETKRKILEFATKYNANAEWRKKAGIGSPAEIYFKTLYSVQLQDAMIDLSGHPILFTASIEDVLRKEGKTYVVFVDGLISPLIRYLLECDSSSASKLARQPVKKFLNDQFAVIARIKGVKKVAFTVKAEPHNEDEADVEIGASSNFLVVGNLVDCMYLDEYVQLDEF